MSIFRFHGLLNVFIDLIWLQLNRIEGNIKVSRSLPIGFIISSKQTYLATEFVLGDARDWIKWHIKTCFFITRCTLHWVFTNVVQPTGGPITSLYIRHGHVSMKEKCPRPNSGFPLASLVIITRELVALSGRENAWQDESNLTQRQRAGWN